MSKTLGAYSIQIFNQSSYLSLYPLLWLHKTLDLKLTDDVLLLILRAVAFSSVFIEKIDILPSFSCTETYLYIFLMRSPSKRFKANLGFNRKLTVNWKSNSFLRGTVENNWNVVHVTPLRSVSDTFIWSLENSDITILSKIANGTGGVAAISSSRSECKEHLCCWPFVNWWLFS